MPKKPLPQFVAPMQASSVKEPFDSPDWIFDTKLDGYRAIAVPPLARFNRPPIYEHGRIFPLLLLMSKSP
jgi:hypothetical protein